MVGQPLPKDWMEHTVAVNKKLTFRSVRMIVAPSCVIVFAPSITRGMVCMYATHIRPFLRSHNGARAYIQPPDRFIRASVSSSVNVSKMVHSTYKKQQILYLYSQGYRPPTIKKMLGKENLQCSRVGVYKFLKLYNATRSISRKVGSGRPSKITAEIKQLVEVQMRIDNETTAYQLH